MTNYEDLSGLSTYDSKGRKVRPVGMVIHHTAGRWPRRYTNPGIIQRLNERGLSVNFVMDRQGRVAHGVAPGAYADHMHPGGYQMDNPPEAIIGLDNSNMLGLEVSARDDRDVLPIQVRNAVKFIADRGMTDGFDPGKTAFGHGEVNGHKQPTEGSKIVTAVRQHHPQSPHQARMSPVPMAEQYAPNFGMWAAPSVWEGTSRAIRVKTTREQGALPSETLPGARFPLKAELDGPWIREVERRYTDLLRQPRTTQDRLTEPWTGGRTYLERLLRLAASGGAFPKFGRRLAN